MELLWGLEYLIEVRGRVGCPPWFQITTEDFRYWYALWILGNACMVLGEGIQGHRKKKHLTLKMFLVPNGAG